MFVIKKTHLTFSGKLEDEHQLLVEWNVWNWKPTARECGKWKLFTWVHIRSQTVCGSIEVCIYDRYDICHDPQPTSSKKPYWFSDRVMAISSVRALQNVICFQMPLLCWAIDHALGVISMDERGCFITITYLHICSYMIYNPQSFTDSSIVLTLFSTLMKNILR